MDYIVAAPDRVQWWGAVETVMKLRVL